VRCQAGATAAAAAQLLHSYCTADEHVAHHVVFVSSCSVLLYAAVFCVMHQCAASQCSITVQRQQQQQQRLLLAAMVRHIVLMCSLQASLNGETPPWWRLICCKSGSSCSIVSSAAPQEALSWVSCCRMCCCYLSNLLVQNGLTWHCGAGFNCVIVLVRA
jgi:hypothetical protein